MIHIFPQMPPELLAMMEALLDPKTIEKMVSEVEPSFEYGHLPTEQSCKPQDADEDSHLDCEYQNQPSVAVTQDPQNYQQCSQTERQMSKINRKRTSLDELCTIPTKVPNEVNMCKPITDMYHQSYSPQESVALPHLSPGAIDPLLCSSPSTPQFENHSDYPVNNYMETKDIPAVNESYSLVGTNSVEVQQHNKFKANECGYYQAMPKDSAFLNCNYQTCRQCSRSYTDPRGYHANNSQPFHSYETCAYHHSTRNTNVFDQNHCQYVSLASGSSRFPSFHCCQNQAHPECIGSTNGHIPDNRSFQAQSSPVTYPHTCTNAHPNNYLCGPTVPEFDIKLQRDRQSQELQAFHYNPFSTQGNHHHHHHHLHQRLQHHQGWLPAQADSSLNEYPVAGAMQSFCTFQNHCVSSSSDNQGILGVIALQSCFDYYRNISI